MRILIVGLVFVWMAIKAIVEGLRSGEGIPEGVVVPLLIGVTCIAVGISILKRKGSKAFLEEEDVLMDKDEQRGPDADAARRAIAQKRQAREASPVPSPVREEVAPAVAQAGPFVEERLARQREEVKRLQAKAQAARKKAESIRKARPVRSVGPTPAASVSSIRQALHDPAQLRTLIIASDILNASGGKEHLP